MHASDIIATLSVDKQNLIRAYQFGTGDEDYRRAMEELTDYEKLLATDELADEQGY